MTQEELHRLAEDIAENGLRDPITIAKLNGMQFLADGRNRLEACKLAKIEPRFEIIEFKTDEEIRAFVRSRSERRDISAGQRAMGMAFLYPEPEKGGRGKKGKAAESAGFSQRRLQEARQVLHFSQEIACDVRDGNRKLDEALASVKAQQDEKASDESKLSELSAKAPDLAELVVEERLKLSEAYATLQQREQDLKQERKANAVQLYTIFSELAAKETSEEIAHDLLNYDEESLAKMGLDITAETFVKAITTIKQIQAQWKKAQNAST
jgi:hypothetical protein